MCYTNALDSILLIFIPGSIVVSVLGYLGIIMESLLFNFRGKLNLRHIRRSVS